MKLTKERSEALDESRWQVYRFRLMRMEQLWQQKDWGHLERLLDESVPAPGEKDLRGWEWHYLKAQLDRRVWRIHETPIPEAFANFDWDQDTDRLAVSRSGAVEIWLPGKRQLLKSIPVPVYPPDASVVRWSPDHRYLAVGSHDSKVYVVDTETDEIHCSIPAPAASNDGAYLGHIEWNPHGDCLALTIRDQNISLWKVAAEPVLLKEIGTCDGIVSARIHWKPDQATCVTISYDGWAMYWNLADWTLIEKKKIVHNWCENVAWSPDGTRVAFGSNIVVLSDADGMQTKQLADQGATVTNLRWLDNERLITANEANELRIVHVDQHTPDKVFRLHKQSHCVLSVGPGEQIASFCPGESVKVWSTTETIEEHVTLHGASLPSQPATFQWNSRSNELALVAMEQQGNVAATWSPGSILLETVPGTAGTLGVYWNKSGDALAIKMTDERWNSIPWPIPEKGRPTAMTQRMGSEYSHDGRFRAEIQVNSGPSRDF